MACVRQSIFRSQVAQVAMIAMAVGLWLISGGLASATAPSVQGIITQVADYAASGQIYDAATAADLTDMLTTVSSAIEDGDSFTARSLLDGFTNTVSQMSDHLMTIPAADHLKSLATSLSMSL